MVSDFLMRGCSPLPPGRCGVAGGIQLSSCLGVSGRAGETWFEAVPRAVWDLQ